MAALPRFRGGGLAVDEQSFIAYLEAKRELDDRSLNARTWQRMVGWPWRSAPRVLELGGGIGTMVERVVADGRLGPASWTLLDAQVALVDEARRKLSGRAMFPVRFVVDDAPRFCSQSPAAADLVVAHAFLDLFEPARILPLIRPAAAPGACFYFSINFDGLTAWEPEMDTALDAAIVALYHRTMDERVVDGRPSGDSRTGRHLLALLPRLGYRIEEAGPSDWVIFPRAGRYTPSEHRVLSCLLGFFEESLRGRPELEARDLDRWLGRRRAQLSAGTLSFLAHNLDVLASAE